MSPCPVCLNIDLAVEVLNKWKSLDESRSWGEVQWIRQCVERPEIFILGGSGNEIFQVLEMPQGRILDCDAFSFQNIENSSWKTITDTLQCCGGSQ